MKYTKALIALTLACISLASYSQVPPIRGEVSAGVYKNVAVDASGYILTATTGGTTAVTQSGTWTVQPGNTANTTAWKVDGSAVTQPVSIATAPVLVAGSAVVGKVGIDQTTPGTTNLVAISPTVGTLTDRSGTITLGGTAQTIMASNATRKYLFIQNTSDTTMWCNFTTTAVATQPSFNLSPGAVFVMEGTAVSTELVSCIGATTAKIFTAKEM